MLIQQCFSNGKLFSQLPVCVSVCVCARVCDREYPCMAIEAWASVQSAYLRHISGPYSVLVCQFCTVSLGCLHVPLAVISSTAPGPAPLGTTPALIHRMR